MPDSVTVFAPGSASNLGPGFDCMGVALAGLGDRVTARRAEEPGVRVLSVSDSRIPLDPTRNTAAIGAAAVLERLAARSGVELVVEKGLPVAAGLGGSAASAVAGAVAVNVLMSGGLPRAALLEAALEAEAAVTGRHADNVAPSLLGGAVLVLTMDDSGLVPLRVHPSLEFVLVTPDYLVETVRARAVLPPVVPRADAVAQAAHLAAFTLGLERGDADLIRASMRDWVAEPARKTLYPGYEAAREAALEVGAFGVAMSGSGPTLLAIVPRGLAAVARAAADAYGKAGFAASTRIAAADPSGARVTA
jgi:homoserine kinase